MISLLLKNTLIKIKKSFGRYLSLLAIVMVGVGFFAGIQATSPDIAAVADRYYKDYHLMDFKIVSTMGLTDDDVSSLRALDYTDGVFPSYSLDVLGEGQSIRIHAIEESVNTVRLTGGRMPEAENECIADSKAFGIGDRIRITGDGQAKLKNTEFTVVGTADSVLYLENNYGSTTVGDGKLTSFIFVDKSNFIMEFYTEIYLAAAGTKDTAAYSRQYDSAAQLLYDELVKIKSERENARYEEIYNKANKEILKNETKLNEEKANGEKKLTDAKTELDNSARKLEDARAELIKNEATLQESMNMQNAKFESAKSEIADGHSKINSALTQYGITKNELGIKIGELESAITALERQLSQTSADSAEYVQLHAAIAQYTESCRGLLLLKESIATLNAREYELNEGIKVFNAEMEKAIGEIEQGKKEISSNEKKLSEGYEEYQENSEKFNTETADAQKKINDAKNDLSRIERPQWYIYDRDAAVGYHFLKASIDIIASVAAVLPFFFILIVMLMTSNSMTRMIAEERGELGTLTSLGYKDGNIIATYLFYVLSASGLGTGVGFFAGCRIIPPLIYTMFQFTLPPLVIRFNMITFSLMAAIVLSLMTLATLVSCGKALKQKPAGLMRPVPPKKGQTVWLEKIRPVWKCLSFTWKITFRNMFRYKRRAFMTIVGVAGCTSLLLTGFGLKDSMNGVAEKQYGEIFRYDAMILLKEDTQTIGKDLASLLAAEQIKEPLLLRQNALKCELADKSLDAFLIVPQNERIFYQYYNLKSVDSKTALALNDSGAVITQRLSEVLHVTKGDTFTVIDADNHEYQFIVSDVAENYSSNYIYMSSALYSKVFGKTTSYNTIVSNHNADQKVLAEHLTGSDPVLNVIFTGDVLEEALSNTESLNSIVVLIVVVASLLAFLVLYNLTSINISERTREIATLKVLGFTDGEANGYIYREAVILTFLSIGVGLILGIFLHRFIVGIVEGHATLFFREIKWPSFIWASLLTLVFSGIMQIVTYLKLRTIDMIGSLKSAE